MQSALQAATERLVARDDRRNPLGAGDWRAARAAIAAFYAARVYAPVWVERGRPDRQGEPRCRSSSAPATTASTSRPSRCRTTLDAGLAPDALAEAETTIASAVVVYAEQATGSRVPPSRVSPLIFARRAVADPGAALAETAAASDPARRLADFNPPQKGYRELREELKRLEAPGQRQPPRGRRQRGS